MLVGPRTEVSTKGDFIVAAAFAYGATKAFLQGNELVNGGGVNATDKDLYLPSKISY